MRTLRILREEAVDAIFKQADALREAPGFEIAMPAGSIVTRPASLTPNASAFDCLLWLSTYGTREQIAGVPDRVRAIVSPPDARQDSRR